LRNEVGDSVDHAAAVAPPDQDHLGEVFENRNCAMSCTLVARVAGSIVRTWARSARPVNVGVWTSCQTRRRREATARQAQPRHQPLGRRHSSTLPTTVAVHGVCSAQPVVGSRDGRTGLTPGPVEGERRDSPSKVWPGTTPHRAHDDDAGSVACNAENRIFRSACRQFVSTLSSSTAPPARTSPRIRWTRTLPPAQAPATAQIEMGVRH
jgi:hypothetical protein